jgi:hypothetical protein
MLDKTGNTLNVNSLQVTGTTDPSFADLLLHRVRLVAEMVDASTDDLSSILREFAGDVPDEIWNMTANISQDLETASINIQCAIEDLDAAISAH